MTRVVCLALVMAGLAAAPGCSSCFGGANCRRPSFMEFRSPCGRRAEPHGPVCGPACAPVCGPQCGDGCGGGCGAAGGPVYGGLHAPPMGSEPCCNGGEMILSAPLMGAPVETVPLPAATPSETFS